MALLPILGSKAGKRDRRRCRPRQPGPHAAQSPRHKFLRGASGGPLTTMSCPLRGPPRQTMPQEAHAPMTKIVVGEGAADAADEADDAVATAQTTIESRAMPRRASTVNAVRVPTTRRLLRDGEWRMPSCLAATTRAMMMLIVASRLPRRANLSGGPRPKAKGRATTGQDGDDDVAVGEVAVAATRRQIARPSPSGMAKAAVKLGMTSRCPSAMAVGRAVGQATRMHAGIGLRPRVRTALGGDDDAPARRGAAPRQSGAAQPQNRHHPDGTRPAADAANAGVTPANLVPRVTAVPGPISPRFRAGTTKTTRASNFSAWKRPSGKVGRVRGARTPMMSSRRAALALCSMYPAG